MFNKYIPLILLAFLLISQTSEAQNAAISAKPDIPSKSRQEPDRRLPLAQWDETNQNIRDHFAPMNTITVYTSSSIEINMGPAQMQIIFPFF